MSECISCKYVMNDGMCLAMGKFTTLDAPACAEYLPTDQAIIDTLKTENVKLREFASEAFSMAFNFYHGAGTAEDLRELKVEYHELGIEVDG